MCTRLRPGAGLALVVVGLVTPGSIAVAGPPLVPAPEVTAGAPSLAGPAPSLTVTPPSVGLDLPLPALPAIAPGVTETTGSLVSGAPQPASPAGRAGAAQQQSSPESASPTPPAPEAPQSGADAGEGSTATERPPAAPASSPRRSPTKASPQAAEAPVAAPDDAPAEPRGALGSAGSDPSPATAPTTRRPPSTIERIVGVVPLPLKVALGVLAALLVLALGGAWRTRRRLSRAERLAATDPLTGLPNRRQADEVLVRLVAAARRTGRPLAVALVDLDHFKAINDRYGHTAGDVTLRETGAAIRAFLRCSDHVARFGGEEFLLLLPDTSGTDAMAVAKKLRRRIAGLEVAELDGGVTASLGVAAFPQDGDSPDELINAADAALYRAKENGRDRVEGAGEEHFALVGAAAPAA